MKILIKVKMGVMEIIIGIAVIVVVVEVEFQEVNYRIK
jgi:hypothetical protein